MDYQIPAVFVEREPDSVFCNYVGFRHYDTFYSITKQVLEQGYRDISIVCGPLEFSSERNYVRACRDAMETLGEDLAPEKICATNFTREDAFSSFMKIFSRKPPEVLLSTSREITYGIQTAMEYCGLRTPEDIVLISCSEESWININQNDGVIKISRNSTVLGSRQPGYFCRISITQGCMSRLYRRLIFRKGYPACESAGKRKAAETELPDILQRENPLSVSGQSDYPGTAAAYRTF
ncbi:MAG: hypothetical protein ACLVGQ_11875 [Blautia massiliensis (ex Durand et al. 2017)]|uniref:hypothetical protein n=1 Tax=Blautia massiliensis (ex Durand et al. 2017) TaxID=1737424 RepID=UPI00399CEA7E